MTEEQKIRLGAIIFQIQALGLEIYEKRRSILLDQATDLLVKATLIGGRK